MSEIKDIPLGGVSNEPNDYSHEEGGLSVSLNADKAVTENVDSTSNYTDTTYIMRTIEAHEDTTEGTGDKPPWWALLTILGLLICIIGLVYRRSSPT